MNEEEIKVSNKTKINVLIIDDHPVVREGLKNIINSETDLFVCGEYGDGYLALENIKQTKTDVIILDISLKDISGLDLIPIIRKKYPKVPILILSMHDEDIYAKRVLKAGAQGYIMKIEAQEKLISAIRKVTGGDIYVSDNIVKNILLQSINPKKINTNILSIDCLTNRELEVFKLIGQGNSTRKIAEKLLLSIKTIETYKEHIKEKMNLNNATELIQAAVLWTKNNNKN